jgi:CSLREA domain-containing protein
MGGVLAVALVALACALVVPAVASAEEFTVNSTGDEVDVLVGNNVCLTAGGKCTLRAAIEEADFAEEPARFDFDETIFDGGVAGTIALGSKLPAIEVRTLIHGRECLTAAGVNGPCVGIDGPSSGPALSIKNTEEVEIEGLAVTGAQTGVSVDGSRFFLAQENWFGIKLDGSPGGNGTGILVGPGSDKALIGSEGAERRNVIAGNTGDGLDVHGASRVRVFGNYFGVKPDGTNLAANGGDDVEVTSGPAEGPEAVSTAIGTKVSFEGAATTPECDGGCNVISAAGSSGIDLEGDGGEETPAVATTIAGNYIGLDATGTVPVPNAASDIRVGPAPQTVIGGPKPGEANRINGGDVGVLAGPAAGDLVVRGNLIGVDSTGTARLAPPDEGIVVNSEEFPSPALEAAIVDNAIRMEGGVAIAQQGFGARISGNRISGAGTGIKTSEFAGEHGNLIEGNAIEAPEGNGILVENELNEVFGNEITGAGKAGVLIRGTLPFRVTENLVGGDAASEENVIAGSGGAAVEISNVEKSENEVARNRGSGNGGLFIDLVAAAPGKGPNKGIEPPTISTPTRASAAGSGAEAGATVRVFRKQNAEAGELESFLGEATADAGGNWKVVYGGTIPAGTVVAATQTSEAGGTSELSTATTPAEPGEGGGGGGGNGGASVVADQTPPQTKIVKAPKKKSQARTARFEFQSGEPGTTFQCKLDDKPFRTCKSPKKYEGLKPGKHVFKVRAIDPAGNLDSSPAKRKFTVLD